MLYPNRSGTVESKVRQLVMKLENAEGIVYAHPFVKSFERIYYCINSEEGKQVSTGDIPAHIAKRTKADIEGVNDSLTVHASFFFVGLKLNDAMRGVFDICAYGYSNLIGECLTQLETMEPSR